MMLQYIVKNIICATTRRVRYVSLKKRHNKCIRRLKIIRNECIQILEEILKIYTLLHSNCHNMIVQYEQEFAYLKNKIYFLVSYDSKWMYHKLEQISTESKNIRHNLINRYPQNESNNLYRIKQLKTILAHYYHDDIHNFFNHLQSNTADMEMKNLSGNIEDVSNSFFRSKDKLIELHEGCEHMNKTCDFLRTQNPFVPSHRQDVEINNLCDNTEDVSNLFYRTKDKLTDLHEECHNANKTCNLIRTELSTLNDLLPPHRTDIEINNLCGNTEDVSNLFYRDRKELIELRQGCEHINKTCNLLRTELSTLNDLLLPHNEDSEKSFESN